MMLKFFGILRSVNSSIFRKLELIGLPLLSVCLATTVFAEEIDITYDQVQDGRTVSDLKSPMIQVRFISPFKDFVRHGDKIITKDSRLTITSTITPMLFTKLLARVENATMATDANGNEIETGAHGGFGLDDTFGYAYKEVLRTMNLCQGPRITLEAKIGTILEDCSNYYPAEYVTAVHEFKTYSTWKAGEIKSLFSFYLQKLESTELLDRLEGQLMIDCLERSIGERAENVIGLDKNAETKIPTENALSTDAALSRCTLPDNWELQSLYEIADFDDCKALVNYEGSLNPDDDRNLSTQLLTSYAFDFHKYIEYCVATKDRIFLNESDLSVPAGIRTAIQMIPYLRLELTKPKASDVTTYHDEPEGKPTNLAKLELKYYPMSISADRIYLALYHRVYKIISSQEFQEGQTAGWIPSPLAPDELDFSTDTWREFCSIQLPVAFLQNINLATENLKLTGMSSIEQAAESRIRFAWKMIAQRVAVIQTLEMLLGASQIADESERLLGIVDADLRSILTPSVEYTAIAAKSYRDSIDLTYSTSLEDVVRDLDSLIIDIILVQEKLKSIPDAVKALSTVYK